MSKTHELSVSSIGTNELQLHRSVSFGVVITPFSFLYRNERTATELAQKMSPKSQRAFSFLYRNERTATLLISPPCNTRQGPFSFLYRNERTATFRRNTLMRFASKLSVSSIGTNELQRDYIACAVNLRLRFQFPLSERTNCNC